MDYQGITGKKSPFISNSFFIFGLLGGVGLRIVLLANKISSFGASLIFYSASIIYIIFYFYRLYIEEKRRKLIIDSGIRQKIIEGKTLDSEDNIKLRQIIDSIMVSKWRWNLIILIVLSFLAIVLQLIADLIWK